MMIKMTTISSDNETTFSDNTTKNDSDDSGGSVVEAITIFISFMAKTILVAFTEAPQMQTINYKSKKLTTTKNIKHGSWCWPAWTSVTIFILSYTMARNRRCLNCGLHFVS